MPNSKQIVYLSQAQYAELIANGSITVNGVTVTYDENDIYVTPQAEPVTDVRVNGTSVAANGVANVPVASASAPGVISVRDGYDGVRLLFGHRLTITPTNSSQIKAGNDAYLPVTTMRQHESAFYGLAKAAGHDEKDSTESVGTYTPEAKGAIQSMLGVSDLIAPAENTLVASKAYAIGDVFTANGKLYKVTAAIAANDTIVLQNSGETVSGANVVESNVGEGFPHDVQVNGVSVVNNGVADIPTCSGSRFGVVKPSDNSFTYYDGALRIKTPDASDLKAGNNGWKAVTPAHQHSSTFYGLAKAAGDTTQSQSSNAVGTYTDSAKASIQHMLGTDTNLADYEFDTTSDAAYAIGELFMLNGKLHQATAAIAIGDTLEVGTNCSVVNVASVFPHDVQVNETSVVSNGVANVPYAGSNVAGVVVIAPNSTGGLSVNPNNGRIATFAAVNSELKSGVDFYKPIVPAYQHVSTFYGLAKASGDTTQSQSSNPVGQYTDDAKSAIQTMLNVIPAPSSPATGAFLVWSGSAWVAQTLSTWQGGNY